MLQRTSKLEDWVQRRTEQGQYKGNMDQTWAGAKRSRNLTLLCSCGVSKISNRPLPLTSTPPSTHVYVKMGRTRCSLMGSNWIGAIVHAVAEGRMGPRRIFNLKKTRAVQEPARY